MTPFEEAIRDAMSFAIWSVSGPTNQAEVEHLEVLIDAAWQEYRPNLEQDGRWCPAEHVLMPLSVKEAQMMNLLSEQYLKAQQSAPQNNSLSRSNGVRQ